MKILLNTVVLVFWAGSLFAQAESYQKAAKRFQQYYNDHRYNLIFSDFSLEMKAALPLNSTTEFLSGLGRDLGKLVNLEFIQLNSDNYASFKAAFEKGTDSFNLSLNKTLQIDGFFFRPFIEHNSHVRKAINQLKSIPDSLAALVFEHTAYFPNHTQLSIAVIKNGQATYYGMVRRRDTITGIHNSRKVFEIGSITKVFTATILANAVIDHQVALTDPVNPYFQYAFRANEPISFLSLANHSSGLPRMPSNFIYSQNPYKKYDSTMLREYLTNSMVSETAPGTKYAYSNLGAAMLGYALSLLKRQSFVHLLNSEIFQKYKMSNTYTSSGQIPQDRLVAGLDSNGVKTNNWDFDVFMSGGGMLSTVEDLSKFAKAQFDPKNSALALTRKPTFTVSRNMKMGLGWHLLQTEAGRTRYWKNGGTGGYTSSMALDTDNKTGVIILSNVSGFSQSTGEIDALCFALMDAIEK